MRAAAHFDRNERHAYFADRTLVHRIISRRHTARRPPGQLADFQGGPSRTGGYDEHPAPVLHSYRSPSNAASAKLVRDVRSESGGRRTENQSTGHGPKGLL